MKITIKSGHPRCLFSSEEHEVEQTMTLTALLDYFTTKHGQRMDRADEPYFRKSTSFDPLQDLLSLESNGIQDGDTLILLSTLE